MSRMTEVSTLSKLVRFAVVGTLATVLTAQVTGIKLVTSAKADDGEGAAEISCRDNCDGQDLIGDFACESEYKAGVAACEAAETAAQVECYNEFVEADNDGDEGFVAFGSCLSGTESADAACQSGLYGEEQNCLSFVDLHDVICDAICEFLSDGGFLFPF